VLNEVVELHRESDVEVLALHFGRLPDGGTVIPPALLEPSSSRPGPRTCESSIQANTSFVSRGQKAAAERSVVVREAEKQRVIGFAFPSPGGGNTHRLVRPCDTSSGETVDFARIGKASSTATRR